MLKTLHQLLEKRARLVFVILFGCMIGPLVLFFGSGSCETYFRHSTAPFYAGSLMGENITISEFQQQLYAVVLANSFFKQGHLVDLKRVHREDTYRDLGPAVIDRIRVLRLLKDLNLDHVTDEEVALYKRTLKPFQTNGRFDADKYQSFVSEFFRDQPIKLVDFDQIVRDEIVLKRFRLFLASLIPSVPELRLRILEGTLRKDYLYRVFKPQNLNNFSVTEEEMRKYYEDYKETDLKIPAKLQATLVFFQEETRPEGAEMVKESDIQEYYQKHQKEFTVPRQVRARHILISHKDAAYSQHNRSKDEAKTLVEQLLAILKKNPQEFPKLVQAYSDDPGTKDNDGDLGFFTYEMMAEPFAKAAFDLKQGEISGVVETEFGYHVIEKIEEKPETLRPLAEVYDTVKEKVEAERDRPIYEALAHVSYKKNEKEYQKEQSRFSILRLSSEGTSDANSSHDSTEQKLDEQKAQEILKAAKLSQDLEKFVNELKKQNPHLNVNHWFSNWYHVQDPNIPSYLQGYFKLEKGAISDLIKGDNHDWYIVQKYETRSVVPFEEVRDSIIQKIKEEIRQKRVDTIQQKIAQLRERAQTMTKMEEIVEFARNLGANIADLPPIGPNDHQRIEGVFGGALSASYFYQYIKGLSPDRRIGEVFTYKNYHILPILQSSLPARVPSYEEVREKVKETIQKGKAIAESRREAEVFYKQLKEFLDQKKDLSEQLKFFREPKDYTRQPWMMPSEQREAEKLAQKAASLSVEMGNIDEGAIVVYVKGYKKQNKDELQRYMDMFTNYLLRDEDAEYVWNPYMNYLRKRYPFTPSTQFAKILESRSREE